MIENKIKFQFESIRARLVFWFCIMVLAALTAASAMIYRGIVTSRKASIYEKLEAIRGIKVRELNNWLEERTGDVCAIAADKYIRGLEGIYKRPEHGSLQKTGISEARDILKGYLNNSIAFQEIFVIDAQNNRIIVSTNESNDGMVFPRHFTINKPFQAVALPIRDIYYSESENRPDMVFSMPVFGPGGNSRVAGFVIARVDLETTLYRLLLDRIGLGNTGETLIVNSNRVALNELRWHNDAPFKLNIRGRHAAEAADGRTGIMESEDYRGERVLAAYTHIPETDWGVIVKQDLSEVYAPIYHLRNRIIVTVMIVMLAVMLAAVRVAKTISRPIEEIHRGSEIIGRGNLDHMVGTDRKDEIGQLSRTFDQMMANIKKITASRDELDNEIAERRHLEKAVLEIEEMERQRIGHDLHDGLGQLLTGISYKIQFLKSSLEDKLMPEAEEAARIAFFVDSAKEQARNLSKGLSPLVAKGEDNLMAAIRDIISVTKNMFNVNCLLRCDGPVHVNDEPAVMHLYRIAQEAVTNAVKHAGAETIEINLDKKDGFIRLEISDDGKGIPAAEESGSGMGLRIMNYRARMINAVLDIRPGITGGTVVECVFPDRGGRESCNINDKTGEKCHERA